MSNYSTIQKDQLHKLGSYLKETREEQGKSIEEISLQTYIRPQLIMRIEAGDAVDLPQPIFVQGFIRRYADALGLDGMKLSRQFPVHSIPDTPRPTPRPAVPISPLALGRPPVVKPPASQPPTSTVPSTDTSHNPAADTLPVANSLESSGVAKDSVLTGDAPEPAKDSVLTGDVPDASSRPVIKNGAVGGADLPMANSVPSALPASPSMTTSNGWESPRSQSLEPASNKTPYILAGVLAALVVGAIALLTNLPGSNQPEQTEQTEPVPVTEVTETPPVPEPEPEPEPVSPTSSSTAPVAVSVSLTDDSWMRVTVDGTVVFAETMAAGTEEIYEAQESIYIRAGNAGAVMLSHNGSLPSVAGAPGDIEDLYFTPEAVPEASPSEAAE